MKNNIISKEEIQIVNNIIEMTQKLVDCHLENPLKPEVIDKVNEVEQLQAVMYLQMFKDMTFHILAMKDLLGMTDEETIELVTEGGKKTLKEATMEIMLKTLLN